jgi:hypothetical protein
MRHLAPAALLVVGLLLAAGCGGGGGSSGGDWAVLDQGKFSSNEPAYLNTTVGRPGDVEVRVEASPNVTTTTSFSIGCGTNVDSMNRRGPAGPTPLTGQLRIPPGPPGACFVRILATKSKPAEITLTLLARSPASG